MRKECFSKKKRDGRTHGQTDRRTYGRRGPLQYLPSRAFGAAGDNKKAEAPIPRTCTDADWGGGGGGGHDPDIQNPERN